MARRTALKGLPGWTARRRGLARRHSWTAFAKSGRFVLLLLLGSSFGLAIVSGCARPSRHVPQQAAPRPPAAAPPVADVRKLERTLTAEEAAQYAGNAACAQCHGEIFRQHEASAHAQALRLVSPSLHGRYFRMNARVRDPLLNTIYGVRAGPDGCFMTMEGPSGRESLRADLAVGSGRAGQTYLHHAGLGEWITLRISYYRSAHGWTFTPKQKPGEEAFAPRAGVPMDAARTLSCLRCHTTFQVASPDGPDLKRSPLGVGCERCHGPAQAHVQSARAVFQHKQGAISPMEDLRHAPSARILSICGPCHSTETSPAIGDPHTEAGLPRFQATALERSACYKSTGALSCITCHDPHTNVSTDVRAYERVCLGCHAGAARRGAARCPVNPSAGCIRCHMPLQPIAALPGTLYHNHWIKVWRNPAAHPRAAAGEQLKAREP